MTSKNQYDVIIAGAGGAGLSLLWHIMNSPMLKGYNVLLVDKSFDPVNDKTWCFWEDLEITSEVEIYHSWKDLEVQIGGKVHSEKLKNHIYQCLRSKDFSEKILQKARSLESITFLEEDINGFYSNEDFGHIQTSNGEYRSKYIFQSALLPPNFNNRKVDISLTQHFLGWEIKSSSNLFNPDVATFMDFDVPQMDGLSFIYLLPFSKKRALVEYTIFSKSPLEKEQYREQIINYLSNRYELLQDSFTIQREEFGLIPMEDRSYPVNYCDHVWNIGTMGGLAKPSTGYTFSRIQKQSSEIIKCLELGNQITLNSPSSYRFRVYDIMMLYLMAYESENALKAFKYLFEKNQIDKILDFLSEETTIPHELSIFSQMPYLPFFRSMYAMKHRIFTGA